MIRLSSLVLCGVLAIAGMGHGDSVRAVQAKKTAKSTTTSTKPKTPTAASDWLTPTTRKRADQLISVFENSTPEIQYDYAENLQDGRGVTAGRAGFTTATCDALLVIRRYGSKGKVSFQEFTAELQRLCDEHSEATDSLPESKYIERWKQAAADPLFRAAQDEIVNELYYIPAMKRSDALGLRTPLARTELFDAAIQHGNGNDDDGLPALIGRAQTASIAADSNSMSGGRVRPGYEKVWLRAFLDVREADLLNPANDATSEVWAESVDRVTCIRSLLSVQNFSMDPPLKCSVYGTTFTIK